MSGEAGDLEGFPGALATRFRPARRLGAGAFGAVFLAEDRELPRMVAVKVLHGLRSDPESLARFEQEARVTGKVTHPNVVKVHDSGVTPDGLAFIVYEFVEGEDLATRLGRGPLAAGEARRVGAELAGALQVAHEEGVLHRDVKPGNVILRAADGGGVLCDFGVARSSSPDGVRTATGMILGTPAYLAPEVLLGEEPGPAADQFALAGTLLFATTGELPYGGEGVEQVLAEVARAGPLPGLGRAGSAGLGGALRRALARDPAARYPDLSAFAAALGDPGGEVASPRRGAPPGGPVAGAGPRTRALGGPRGGGPASPFPGGEAPSTRVLEGPGGDGQAPPPAGGGAPRAPAREDPAAAGAPGPDSGSGAAWLRGVAAGLAVLACLTLASLAPRAAPPPLAPPTSVAAAGSARGDVARDLAAFGRVHGEGFDVDPGDHAAHVVASIPALGDPRFVVAMTRLLGSVVTWMEERVAAGRAPPRAGSEDGELLATAVHALSHATRDLERFRSASASLTLEGHLPAEDLAIPTRRWGELVEGMRRQVPRLQALPILPFGGLATLEGEYARHLGVAPAWVSSDRNHAVLAASRDPAVRVASASRQRDLLRWLLENDTDLEGACPRAAARLDRAREVALAPGEAGSTHDECLAYSLALQAAAALRRRCPGEVSPGFAPLARDLRGRSRAACGELRGGYGEVETERATRRFLDSPPGPGPEEAALRAELRTWLGRADADADPARARDRVRALMERLEELHPSTALPPGPGESRDVRVATRGEILATATQRVFEDLLDALLALLRTARANPPGDPEVDPAWVPPAPRALDYLNHIRADVDDLRNSLPRLVIFRKDPSLSVAAERAFHLGKHLSQRVQAFTDDVLDLPGRPGATLLLELARLRGPAQEVRMRRLGELLATRMGDASPGELADLFRAWVYVGSVAVHGFDGPTDVGCAELRAWADVAEEVYLARRDEIMDRAFLAANILREAARRSEVCGFPVGRARARVAEVMGHLAREEAEVIRGARGQVAGLLEDAGRGQVWQREAGELAPRLAALAARFR